MANTIQIAVSAKVSADGSSPQLNKTLSLAQAGTKFFCDIETVGTAAATVAVAGCANLGYAVLYNPSDSTKTITVTAAPIVLIPGRIAVFPPSSLAITCQATAAAAALNKWGAEA